MPEKKNRPCERMSQLTQRQMEYMALDELKEWADEEIAAESAAPEKWYHSREGWLAHFRQHFGVVISIVQRFSGSAAACELRQFEHIGADAPDARYRRLCDILQDAWGDAPDAAWIRSIPGWFTLCDLCSEEPILWEGREEEAE